MGDALAAMVKAMAEEVARQVEASAAGQRAAGYTSTTFDLSPKIPGVVTPGSAFDVEKVARAGLSGLKVPTPQVEQAGWSFCGSEGQACLDAIIDKIIEEKT